MRLRSLLAAALLACASAAPLAAQGVLRPGDAGLDAGRMSARQDTFEVFYAEKPVGQMIARTALERVDGRDVVVRTERLRVMQLWNVDSIVLVRPSLRPVLHRTSGFSDLVLEFGDGRVTGVRDDGPREVPVDEALDEPVFLAAAMDLVLGALPLESGYAARVAMFDPEQGEVIVRVEVGALDAVETPGGTVPAWRVRVRGTHFEGTYWMAEGTRTLVQFVAADQSVRIVRGVREPAGLRAGR